jgi:hypothetical protein
LPIAYPSISLSSNPIQNLKDYFYMFLGLLPAPLVTWTIAASTVAAMFARPRRIPEAVWACLGASLLLALHLVPFAEALGAVTKGYDVYLFLTGMMVLAELARREGVFDWLANFALRAAAGSPKRLFIFSYSGLLRDRIERLHACESQSIIWPACDPKKCCPKNRLKFRYFQWLADVAKLTSFWASRSSN